MLWKRLVCLAAAWCWGLALLSAQHSKVPANLREVLGMHVGKLNFTGWRSRIELARRYPDEKSWTKKEQLGNSVIRVRFDRKCVVKEVWFHKRSSQTKFQSEYAYLDYAQAFLKRSDLWNRSVKFRLASGETKVWKVTGISGLGPDVTASLVWHPQEIQLHFKLK